MAQVAHRAVAAEAALALKVPPVAYMLALAAYMAVVQGREWASQPGLLRVSGRSRHRTLGRRRRLVSVRPGNSGRSSWARLVTCRNRYKRYRQLHREYYS